MLRLSLTPSLYFSEWQEIKIGSDAGGNTACEGPDYSRHRYLEGPRKDSNSGREGGVVHGVFTNVGFWPEK